MTLDLDVICISSVPIAGIAATGTASAGHLILRDDELVALASLDDELAAPTLFDSANYRAAKKAMLKPVDHDALKMSDDFADSLAVGAALHWIY
jgi:hypothetical protein